MGELTDISKLARAAKDYARDVAELVIAGSTTEATYYPAVKMLLAAALAAERLPFDVRINTSEQKSGGGTNLPDVALYDAGGKFLVLCGEVKLPTKELTDLATSTEQNDQIGRYLAATRAVLISNVRGFALVTVKPEWKNGDGPVPPDHRRIEQLVELFPSVAALTQAKPIPSESLADLCALVETAVTRYAPIAEPESLARILAHQARRAKADLPETFTNAVQGLLDDFGKALGVTFVGPEGEEFFRSSLIQTAFYGLFAGWALWWHGDRAKAFRWGDLGDYLRIPFLGSLFYEFRHPTRIKELRLAKHLDIAAETLVRVDGESFFERFRLPTLEHEDEATGPAIMHFYEPFLAAFDPQLRKELGVWYTPTPIVRYMVGKIDRLLREELGCSRGFADEKVIVLDPACGTGAYLLEALRYVAEQLEAEGAGATLAAKLLNAACQRFIGFELLTAPFVIAQLQLYLVLARSGVAPDEKHRPAIFLTNALTGWQGPEQLKLNFPELQDEHDAATRVKREAKIIVVLGNPPYNRYAGVPLAEEADLVDYYKGITRDQTGRQLGQTLLYSRWGVRKHLLDDLYIRFFRLADIRIGEKAEYGVVSFISNSSYLTGRSHPIMRESLLAHFDAVWIDNLHGNRIASERTPWGHSCETIFNTEEIGPGIKVGTCVSTFLKRGASLDQPTTVYVRDFWGRAESKRNALLSSLSMDAWSQSERETAAAKPEGPRLYREVQPSAGTAWKFSPSKDGGFEDWPGFDDLFPKSFQGVNPNRGLDGSVIDTNRDTLLGRMQEYFSKMSFGELEARHPVLCEPRARYRANETRERLRNAGGFDQQKLLPYVLFPFDARWIYYEREAKFLNEARSELGEHLKANEFLVGTPQPRRVSESRPILLTELFDLHLHDWGSVGFPAEVNPNAREGVLFEADPHEVATTANLANGVWAALKAHWGLEGDLRGNDAKQLCRKLFRHCLGIAHAPQYEFDHKDSLAQGWPHIPIPKDKQQLEVSVQLGDSVSQLLNPFAHPASILATILAEDTKTLAVVQAVGGGSVTESDLIVEYSYYGAAKGRWDERAPNVGEACRVEWGLRTGNLYLNERVFFCNVPQEIWKYQLGGYPVLKKWLGYRLASRRGNTALTFNELDHFRLIVMRIAALLSLRAKLDDAYSLAASNAWSIEEFEIPSQSP